MDFVRFKHARFSARLPANFRYSLSHYWMYPEEENEDVWRVGFTKFATRMLGELVEARYEVKQGGAVSSGQQIGYVEGFKAASDLFCVVDGAFERGNPILEEDACIVKSSPYVDGWLYSVKGEPEESSVDVNGYVEHLGVLIERMQQEGY
ncbi:MAG: glycine cleavage system protein H [Verrucomicrobiales bacterium]|jgi:glycine cleavage system H protein|nr:glycine cleavage system protein H [Verrucomicrobiales bacterium]